MRTKGESTYHFHGITTMSYKVRAFAVVVVMASYICDCIINVFLCTI